MNKPIRQAGYFLSSQYFSDGIRITLSILLPALIFGHFNQLQTGLAISLGALNVSISDAPGPVAHRRNGMVISALISFAVTIITGFARMNHYVLGVEVLLFSFFFSMFAIYGNRAASVGTAALLIMILTLDRPMDAAGVIREGFLVLTGSVWYSTISLLASRLQPYRLAQQALGQCIHEIAKLMAIKADFYDMSTSLDDNYRRLIAQQVNVSEKQDAVREILFKSRRIVTESTQTGRLLVLTFVDVIDLYEQIIAMYYDYADIRERFGPTGILDQIAYSIRQLSADLDRIGLSIQLPVSSYKSRAINLDLSTLKQNIDALGNEEGSTLILKKVLVSLRTVGQRIAKVKNNLLAKPDKNTVDIASLEYGRFVSHQHISWKSFVDNLTLKSSVFRHSIRVAIAMLTGYIITQQLPYGHYSYWTLLTISVILKPAFSLSKQRNIERIIGTLAGGIMGVLILAFIPDTTVRFWFMVLFMIGAYSAQRVNHIVMVIFLTPFVLILFSFLGINYVGAAEERVFDTILGGLIAFVASYVLFPRWESEQLLEPMKDVLKANVHYVQLLLDSLSGQPINLVDYKLARKAIYVTSANLSGAFDRMLSEPKHTQRNEKLIYEFVVLNHILSANVATILSAQLTEDHKTYSATFLRPVKRALFSLSDALQQLGEFHEKPPTEQSKSLVNDMVLRSEDDNLLSEQLDFIQQISGDISKAVAKSNLKN